MSCSCSMEDLSLEQEKEANRAERSLEATNKLTNPSVGGERGRSWPLSGLHGGDERRRGEAEAMMY